jgi:hypothetical protein
LDIVDKRLFVAALVGAALSSAFLIAPSAFHRLLFRDGHKEWLVMQANRLVITGTVLLALSVSSSLWLVIDVIYGQAIASAAAGGVGLLFVGLWYVVPLVHRARHDRR